MQIHPTLPIKHKNKIIEIDEDIAELITFLWEYDIDTISCCQCEFDGKYIGKIYIQFTGNSYKKFINIITDYDNPNDKQQLELYHAVYDGIDIISDIMIRDKNSPIVDFPKDHCNMYQYQKPYPKFDYFVNAYIDPKYKKDIIDKLNKIKIDETKERLDYISGYY